MSQQFTPESEIWALFDAACGDALETDQVERLESALRADERLCDLYLDYFRLHAELSRSVRLKRTREKIIGAIHQPESVDSIPPIVLDLSSTNYSPTTPFVGSWAFSCMVSAVIMGVMLLGFWAYKITHHQPRVAETPSQSVPSDAGPEWVFVGRITGMVDVKWSDDPRYSPPLGYACVRLGRKYILSSGLLEITYDSGAKIILEGPCTYEVESTAGGYLALGKLTARIEGRREKREERAQTADSASSLIPHPSSLFSVRTPTAVVTDLGTEFGVEVSEEGTTESRVFRGSVRVQVVSDEGRGQDMVLRENESARVERADGTGQMSIIRCAAGKAPSGFVRAMPRPKPAVAPEIVERFNGAKLGAAFEQNPPRHYVFECGAALHSPPLTDDGRGRQSRGYIRTVATDFCDRDFVFEATFQVRLDVLGEAGYHWIFFGIGDGVPNANHYDEVSSGLVMVFGVDSGRALMRLCRPDTTVAHEGGGSKWVAKITPPGSLGSGRHRFRMSKVGKWATFAVDADFNGQFHADFASQPLDLPATAPLLDATNSRLLVGTGCCDTMTVRFEELSVTFPKKNVAGTLRVPSAQGAIRPANTADGTRSVPATLSQPDGRDPAAETAIEKGDEPMNGP